MKITADMLRRQAGFARRSVRDIIREPAVGRELPQLLATRGRSTVRLRLPWLPFRLVDELAGRIGPESRVFEYGGGGSTLWFLDRGAEVVTVEHHLAWADVLARSVDPERWTLLRRDVEPDDTDYVGAIGDYPDDWFDLVVVDGRERVRCLVASMPKVRPGGWLLLDDSDRERYAPALEACPWPHRQVVGFAPAKPTLAYTTVLQRPPA